MTFLLLTFSSCTPASNCDPPSYAAPCHNWNCEFDGLVCDAESYTCYAACRTDADCEEWADRDEEFVCEDGHCSGPFCIGYF